MRSREETLGRIDDKLFGVYVTSGGSTGPGCALLARLNGSTTVLIEARNFAGVTSKVSSEVDNGKSELESRGERHGVRFGA
jgi:glycerol-3-phosphate dehydrogenase